MPSEGDLVAITMPQGRWTGRYEGPTKQPIWEKWEAEPVFGIVTYSYLNEGYDDKVTVSVRDLTGVAGKPLSITLDARYVTMVLPKASLDVLPWAPEPVWEEDDV